MKLILLGGFLGSGKTTAITNAAHQMIDSNRKVAVITNDQGEQQVDSLHLQRSSIPVEEVANGCFCCNYTQLDTHIDSLLQTYEPEIIFAESVGSCTDMVATIAKPMAKYRPQVEVVIVVFADAALLLALMEGRASFIAENIRYIYRKQLEEADIIVINKSDTVSPAELKKVNQIVREEYGDKMIVNQNSTNAEDVRNWLHIVEGFKAPAMRSSLFIAYELYAIGEAELAWLDKKIMIHSIQNNAADVALQLVHNIYHELLKEKMVIGHLKVFMEVGDWKQKLSFTLTTGIGEPARTSIRTTDCTVLINARVQTDPLRLKELVEAVTQQTAAQTRSDITAGKEAYFQPGYPKPTYRFR